MADATKQKRGMENRYLTGLGLWRMPPHAAPRLLSRRDGGDGATPMPRWYVACLWRRDGRCGPEVAWYLGTSQPARYMLFCFVLDIFTRQWLAYRFGTLATTDVAIESLAEAVAAAKLDCPRLTLQCDNGSQYAGKRFQKAASLLDIYLSFIRTHTPDKTATWNNSTALSSMSGRATSPTTSRRRPSYQNLFGLQPEPIALGAQVRPAGRVSSIIGGEA